MKLTQQYVKLDAGSYQWQRHYFQYGAGFPEHSHEFHEFFLLTDGVMRHRWNGRETLLRPGALQLLLPNDAHQLDPAEPGGAIRLYNCNIKSEELRKIWFFLTGGSELLIADLPQTVPDLPAPVRVALEEKMARAVQLQSDGAAGVEFTALSRAITQEVCYLLLHRAASGGGASVKPPWLDAALAEMQQEAALREGLPKLQQLAARSPEHLCRSLRKYCGVTPAEWILDARLRFAERLLEASSLPVGEIAARAGFANLSYFRRTFRRRNNMSPREFRRKWGEE